MLRVKNNGDHKELRLYYSGAKERPTKPQLKKLAKRELEQALTWLESGHVSGGGAAGFSSGFSDLLVEEAK